MFFIHTLDVEYTVLYSRVPEHKLATHVHRLLMQANDGSINTIIVIYHSLILSSKLNSV